MLQRKFSLLFLHASTSETLYTNTNQLKCLIEIRILKTPQTVTETVGKKLLCCHFGISLKLLTSASQSETKMSD